MMEMRDAMISETLEITRVTEIQETVLGGMEAMEQMEMDAYKQPESSQEALEQQEMDVVEDQERLGQKLIYYPDGEENRSGRDDRLGEYRIFADTRPTVSSYDIFADGKR